MNAVPPLAHYGPYNSDEGNHNYFEEKTYSQSIVAAIYFTTLRPYF